MHLLHRYNPISRQQFGDEVFRHFYTADAQTPEDDSTATSHRLALMFMVLAIGTLTDPEEPPYSVEAEKYHHLARAALFKSSIFDDPTLHAVQALVSLDLDSSLTPLSTHVGK